MTEQFQENVRDAEQSFHTAQSAVAQSFQDSVELFRKGVERTIEIQRSALDVAARQNTETADLGSSVFSNIPGMDFMFSIAENTVGQFIGMQKSFLDRLASRAANSQI